MFPTSTLSLSLWLFWISQKAFSSNYHLCRPCTAFRLQHFVQYIKNITRWWEDMNFMFEQYKHLQYCSRLEDIKIHIFEPTCNVLLLYKHTDDGAFDKFPKISNHFPKLLRRPDEYSWTFFENFQRFPKIAKDWRGRPEEVLIIHQPV